MVYHFMIRFRYTMYHFYLKLSLILFFVASNDALKRTLSEPIYNPDCDEGQTVCSSETGGASYTANVVLTKSTCNTDTIYYIWSSIGGSPSLTFIRTEPDADVTIDWSGMQNTTGYPDIVVYGNILSTAAYVLTGIWKCDSANPDATTVEIPLSLSDCQDYLTYISLKGVKWYNNSHTIAPVGSSGYTFSFRSDDLAVNGSLSIQITIYNSDGREDTTTGLESALHSENSTQFMVVLDQFPDSGSSRYSLEHLYIGKRSADIVFKEHRGLNDQFTPGVFKYQQYNSEPVKSAKSLDTFFGWKDAGYKSSKLDLENIVNIYMEDPDSPVVSEGVEAFDSVASLATNYLVEQMDLSSTLLSLAFNMTFGSSKDDDGYDDYLAWEGQLGYGSIQYDALTPLIISITVVGFVVPITVIVLGGVFVYFLKKKQSQKYDLLAKQHQHGDRTNYTDNESDTQRMI